MKTQESEEEKRKAEARRDEKREADKKAARHELKNKHTKQVQEEQTKNYHFLTTEMDRFRKLADELLVQTVA